MMRQRSNKLVLASAVGAVVGLGTTAFGQCVFFSNAECDFVDSVWGPYNNGTGSLTTDPNSSIGTATPIQVDQDGNMLSIAQGQTLKVNGLLGRWADSPASGEAAAGGIDSDTDWYKIKLDAPGRLVIRGTAGNDDGSGNITPWSWDAETSLGNRFIMLVYSADGADQYYGRSSGVTGCLEAFSPLPNGQSVAYVYVPAGEYAIGFDTRYAESGGTTAEQTDPKYAGPVNLSFEITNLPLAYEVCGTATTACDEPGATAGCADAACCDLVCTAIAACCETAWDQSCFDQGVVDCGLFQYACDGSSPVPNDCVGNFQWIDMGDGEAKSASFDLEGALTDGPNDVVRLCESPMGKDVWYLIGPLPAPGNLDISMCNIFDENGDPINDPAGDSVMNLFYNANYSVSNGIGDTSLLPDNYLGCADDSCDTDGDGNTNFGGPSATGIVNGPAGAYVLLRLGSWYDGEGDVNAVPSLSGQFNVSFVSEAYSNGGQDFVIVGSTLYGAAGMNAGRISTTAGQNAQAWVSLAFTLEADAEFDTLAIASYFSNTQPTEIGWRFVTRPQEADPTTGELDSGFGIFGGDGVYALDGSDDGEIIAQGVSAYVDAEDPRDVWSQNGQGPIRFQMDVGAQTLPAGDYWLQVTGVNANTAVVSRIRPCIGAPFGEVWGDPDADGTGAGVFEPLQLLGGQVPDSEVNGTTRATSGDRRFDYYFRSGLVVTDNGDGTFTLNTANAWTPAGYAAYGLDYEGDPLPETATTFGMALQKRTFAQLCPGDLDGSTIVDSGDIGSLLVLFGECPGSTPGCDGDLDGSGFVDSGDIGSLLVLFGPCPE
jgi:hypothetical protein